MTLRIDHLTLMLSSRTLCQDLSFTLQAGQCMALIGQNGVGKSTLLHSITGLIQPTHGHIYYHDQSIFTLKKRARFIGLLPQQLEYTIPISVRDVVSSGRYPHTKNKGADTLSIQAALDKMQLATLQQTLVQTLSGGECQRVRMATLLAQDPEYFLLDEPTNHLDIRYRQQMLTILKNLLVQGKAILLATHDIDFAKHIATHTLLMQHTGKAQVNSHTDLLHHAQLEALFYDT